LTEEIGTTGPGNFLPTERAKTGEERGGEGVAPSIITVTKIDRFHYCGSEVKQRDKNQTPPQVSFFLILFLRKTACRNIPIY
jgi:hypothetical protein